MYKPAEVTLLNGKNSNLNLRAVVAILMVNADNATIRHGDTQCGGLLRFFCIITTLDYVTLLLT